MDGKPLEEPLGRSNGGEAVCFTAGAAGAVFALGAIHAWLAADRRAPEVIAGISTGAVSAAAMQRCCRDLETAKGNAEVGSEKIEATRWKWFRKYLFALSESPLEVIFKAFPRPIDLFADKPPVIDYSCPPPLRESEKDARTHHYRLTRLGIWLGRLPIKLSTAASLVVNLVRWREGYGGPLALFAAIWHAAKCGGALVWHTGFTPLFIWEWQFLFPDERKFGAAMLAIKPLLGWTAWGSAVLLLLAFTALIVASMGLLIGIALMGAAADDRGIVLLLGTIAGVAALALLLAAHAILRAASGSPSSRGGLGGAHGSLFRALGIDRGLLRDYHLHRRLLELFGDPDSTTGQPVKDVEIREGSPNIVIVAAPLERVRSRVPNSKDSKYEVFAAPGRVTLVQALRAALAKPGLFSPVEADPEQWGIDPEEVHWPSPRSKGKLHLVDGSVFRQTPLPGLLSWMRYSPAARAGNRVGRVHIFYDVPIEAKPTPDNREKVNIFEAAGESMNLARRRDTRQQAHHVRFVSRLGRLIPETETSGSRPFPLDVTEIAPEDDISFENVLDPKRPEVLAQAARGCRRTLEALYGGECGVEGDVVCGTFLSSIAPARGAWTQHSPGLPEICGHCTQILHFPTAERVPGHDYALSATFGKLERPESVHLLPGFRALDGTRSTVTVLASGGAFRGVTHIGLISALIAANIKPDLVVGASVGALMGAALCSIADMLRNDEREEARARVREMVDLFRNIDSRVTLTDSLKSALRQLGVRARHIHLSPSKVRRLIRKGSGWDAGFAATGAPPELIDAISELFLIPHQQTSAIAARFVAGHFADAMKKLWEQLQRETLRRLNIESALIGSSLLELQVHRIVRPHKAEREWHRNIQPYGETKFFCTASDINRGVPMLLGRDFLTPSETYNFVEACLSSSAFPVLFSPRRESEVLPGRGRTNALFFDGGMFDNLPFLPAIEVIGRIQRERLAGACVDEALADLEKRQANPHVFIAASLTAEPEAYDDEQANLHRILRQTRDRKSQVKMMGFENSSRTIKREVGTLIQEWKLGAKGCISAADIEQLNGIVVTETLRVLPADRDHLSGAFAVCKTLGLDRHKQEKAIADGCYQTLYMLSRNKVNGLPSVQHQGGGTQSGMCPFFTVDNSVIACPFSSNSSTENIRHVCSRDEAHVKQSSPH